MAFLTPGLGLGLGLGIGIELLLALTLGLELRLGHRLGIEREVGLGLGLGRTFHRFVRWQATVPVGEGRKAGTLRRWSDRVRTIGIWTLNIDVIWTAAARLECK